MAVLKSLSKKTEKSLSPKNKGSVIQVLDRGGLKSKLSQVNAINVIDNFNIHQAPAEPYIPQSTSSIQPIKPWNTAPTYIPTYSIPPIVDPAVKPALSPRSLAFVERNNDILQRRKIEHSPRSPSPDSFHDETSKRWSESPPLIQRSNIRRSGSRKRRISPYRRTPSPRRSISRSPVPIKYARSPPPRSPTQKSRSPYGGSSRSKWRRSSRSPISKRARTKSRSPAKYNNSSKTNPVRRQSNSPPRHNNGSRSNLDRSPRRHNNRQNNRSPINKRRSNTPTNNPRNIRRRSHSPDRRKVGQSYKRSRSPSRNTNRRWSRDRDHNNKRDNENNKYNRRRNDRKNNYDSRNSNRDNNNGVRNNYKNRSNSRTPPLRTTQENTISTTKEELKTLPTITEEIAVSETKKIEEEIQKPNDEVKTDISEIPLKEIIYETSDDKEDKLSLTSNISDFNDTSDEENDGDEIDLFASEESESENEGRFKSSSSKYKEAEKKPATLSFSNLGNAATTTICDLNDISSVNPSNRDDNKNGRNYKMGKGGGKDSDRDRTYTRKSNYRSERVDRKYRNSPYNRDSNKDNDDSSKKEFTSSNSKFRSTFQTIENGDLKSDKILTHGMIFDFILYTIMCGIDIDFVIFCLLQPILILQ